MNNKLNFLIAICAFNYLSASLEMSWKPMPINSFGMDDKSLNFGNSFNLPPQNYGGSSQEEAISPEELESMQNSFFQMLDNIPESELFKMCDNAVNMAEAEAKEKGMTLNEYLEEQFCAMNQAMPIQTSPLFAKASFGKDSTETDDKKSPSKDDKSSADGDTSKKAAVTIIQETSNVYGSDISGNWLNKRSYAMESKTLITKAQQDLDIVADQKLKLLEQIKDTDDSISKFYKETGNEIGKTLAKSPDKKKQSPSFAIEAFLEEQLKKIADSKASIEEKEDSSKPDLGVMAYKIELVANECRQIMERTRPEIKKLQELEKTLKKRVEQIEKHTKDCSEIVKVMSEKTKQIDHTYNDLTAQKLYSEIEQSQQNVALIKQFLQTDEPSNISSLKSAFNSTAESISKQIKSINEKVTSVLNPFKESL